MLTQQLLKELLHYNPDTGIFTHLMPRFGISVEKKVGTITKKGYVRIKIYGRIYQAHRLVWMYSFGVWPKDQIDHINQIKFDNRICNLRESNSSLNQQNKGLQINNSSGFKGVYWTKSASKWRAIITFNSLDIHLGYFTNLNDAFTARKQAEEQYHTHRVKV